jgi:hypothetical protein
MKTFSLHVIDVVSDAENDDRVPQDVPELMPTPAMSQASGGRDDSVVTQELLSSQDAS